MSYLLLKIELQDSNVQLFISLSEKCSSLQFSNMHPSTTESYSIRTQRHFLKLQFFAAFMATSPLKFEKVQPINAAFGA